MKLTSVIFVSGWWSSVDRKKNFFYLIWAQHLNYKENGCTKQAIVTQQFTYLLRYSEHRDVCHSMRTFPISEVGDWRVVEEIETFSLKRKKGIKYPLF